MKNIKGMVKESGAVARRKIKDDSRYRSTDTNVLPSITQLNEMLEYYDENFMAEEHAKTLLMLNQLSNKLDTEQLEQGVSGFNRYSELLCGENGFALATQAGKLIIIK